MARGASVEASVEVEVEVSVVDMAMEVLTEWVRGVIMDR